MSDLVLVGLAFGLFIVCPRMAGMTHVISKATHLSIVQVAAIGTIFSLPLTIAMVLIFKKLGLPGALTFCVLTDFGSALLMREISLKAGIETFIIALFVLLGVKVASIVSGWIS